MVLKYTPKFDMVSRVLTCVVLAIIFAVGLQFVSVLSQKHIFILATLAIVVLVFINLFPIKYVLTEDELVIKKLFTKRVLRVRNITDLSRIEGPVSFTYSSKGFFGYLGKTMDGATSYSTSLKDNILIKTSKGVQIIISPKDILDFENELRSRLVSSYLYV